MKQGDRRQGAALYPVAVEEAIIGSNPKTPQFWDWLFVSSSHSFAM
jgi:hypothetical protein